jgi:hypothetical protein
MSIKPLFGFDRGGTTMECAILLDPLNPGATPFQEPVPTPQADGYGGFLGAICDLPRIKLATCRDVSESEHRLRSIPAASYSGAAIRSA